MARQTVSFAATPRGIMTLRLTLRFNVGDFTPIFIMRYSETPLLTSTPEELHQKGQTHGSQMNSLCLHKGHLCIRAKGKGVRYGGVPLYVYKCSYTMRVTMFTCKREFRRELYNLGSA